MLKKIVKSVVIGCSLLSVPALAQNTPAAAKVVVYKWTQNGVVHYSTQPPRGKGNVVKLDERGLVIRDDSDVSVTDAIRPLRPDRQESVQPLQPNAVNPPNAGQANSADNELPQGAIPKSERCNNARLEIQTIENAPADQPINIEDADGNLIPMSDEEKRARLESARALVERLCNE